MSSQSQLDSNRDYGLSLNLLKQGVKIKNSQIKTSHKETYNNTY